MNVQAQSPRHQPVVRAAGRPGRRSWLLLALLGISLGGLQFGWAERQTVRLRFVDSETGQAVVPTSVAATPAESPANPVRVRRNGVSKQGETTLTLGEGQHAIRVEAPGYQPMTGDFVLGPANPYQLVFQLDPMVAPGELTPEAVQQLHRFNETIFLGYVMSEATGTPLVGAVVRAEPSGRETQTDARGFFQIYVPVQTPAEAAEAPARLSFSAPDHRTETREYLELWSRGDWIYRIRLDRGEGVKTVDERSLRRRSEYPIATPEEPEVDAVAPSLAPPADSGAPVYNPLASSGEVAAASVTLQLTNAAPVRIPTNIRVLRQDGVTIDYVSLQTYCQRSLPSEWIASWGSTGPGNSGTNSLLAGAVAIRTYAIGFVNNPANSAYDICGTTTCQAYVHTASDSRTTAAVNFTANYVMLTPGATRIGFKLTEYSAENNALDANGPISPCGDGSTGNTAGTCIGDPVCTGELRFGHGRGLCQWGTARWASGRRMQNRVTGDAVTNGYPLRNWVWLLEHYYPNLQLVQGAPLVINDFVQVQGTASVTVRRCADGGIGSGTSCPALTTKASGANGLIVGGPVRVTSDGSGFTWWQVLWFDASATVGWVPENWLERVSPPRNAPPVLSPIANYTVVEGTLLQFTNSAFATSAAEVLLSDFESYANGTSSGTVLFRAPNFSGSTSAYLDASPNLTSVTGTFPSGANGTRALRANWSWNTTNNAWLRLTTSGAANLPNPVVALDRKLQFDFYSERTIGVAVALRETGNSVGTPIGSDGGTTPGIIEFAGVTNVVAGQPQVTRLVAPSNWVTLTFDLSNEPIRSFAGGNGVLSTGSALGTLEQIALVPGAGSGAYNVYFDNFIITTPRTLTYALSNAPAGAILNPTNGVFAWTPSESQGPGVYDIAVLVTDNNLPPATDVKIFRVTVTESNLAPVLAVIPDQVVHAGSIVTWTNSATDADVPVNQLSFTLEPGAPPAASITAGMGIFTWPTSDLGIGQTNQFTVRVTDDGTPPLSDLKSFRVAVLARPAFQSVSPVGTDLELVWSAIPGQRYRVQYKDDLNAPEWTNLGSEVSATQETATVLAAVGSSGQRFYRVQVLPP